MTNFINIIKHIKEKLENKINLDISEDYIRNYISISSPIETKKILSSSIKYVPKNSSLSSDISKNLEENLRKEFDDQAPPASSRKESDDQAPLTSSIKEFDDQTPPTSSTKSIDDQAPPTSSTKSKDDQVKPKSSNLYSISVQEAKKRLKVQSSEEPKYEQVQPTSSRKESYDQAPPTSSTKSIDDQAPPKSSNLYSISVQEAIKRKKVQSSEELQTSPKNLSYNLEMSVKLDPPSSSKKALNEQVSPTDLENVSEDKVQIANESNSPYDQFLNISPREKLFNKKLPISSTINKSMILDVPKPQIFIPQEHVQTSTRQNKSNIYAPYSQIENEKKPPTSSGKGSDNQVQPISSGRTSDDQVPPKSPLKDSDDQVQPISSGMASDNQVQSTSSEKPLDNQVQSTSSKEKLFYKKIPNSSGISSKSEENIKKSEENEISTLSSDIKSIETDYISRSDSKQIESEEKEVTSSDSMEIKSDEKIASESISIFVSSSAPIDVDSLSSFDLDNSSEDVPNINDVKDKNQNLKNDIDNSKANKVESNDKKYLNKNRKKLKIKLSKYLRKIIEMSNNLKKLFPNVDLKIDPENNEIILKIDKDVSKSSSIDKNEKAINVIQTILKYGNYFNLPDSYDLSHVNDYEMKMNLEDFINKSNEIKGGSNNNLQKSEAQEKRKDQIIKINISQLLNYLVKLENERSKIEIEHDKLIESQQNIYKRFVKLNKKNNEKIIDNIKLILLDKMSENERQLSKEIYLRHIDERKSGSESKKLSRKFMSKSTYQRIKTEGLTEKNDKDIIDRLEFEIELSTYDISPKIYYIEKYDNEFIVYKEKYDMSLYNYLSKEKLNKNQIEYIELNLSKVTELLVSNNRYKFNCWNCVLQNIFIDKDLLKIRLGNFNNSLSIENDILKEEIKNNFIKFYASNLDKNYLKVINIIIDDSTLLRKFNKLIINLQIFYFVRGWFNGFYDLLERSFFIDVVTTNIVEIYNLLNKKFRKSNIRENDRDENISLQNYDAKIIIETIVKSYIQNNVLEYIWLSNRNQYCIKNICANLHLKSYDENEVGNYKYIKITFPDKVLDIFFGSELLSIFKDIYIYEYKTKKIMSGGANFSSGELDELINKIEKDIIAEKENEYDNFSNIMDELDKIFNTWKHDKINFKLNAGNKLNVSNKLKFRLIDLYTLIISLPHELNKSSNINNAIKSKNKLIPNNIESIKFLINIVTNNIRKKKNLKFNKITLDKLIDLFCIFNKFNL